MRRFRPTTWGVAALALVVGACGGADVPSGAGLSVDTSWTWQLLGDVDTSIDVDVYDIDLFDASDETITELHADDRIVVCYFSAGSFESWRPDADEFEPGDLGATLDGWEDERWLDIRSATVRAAVERRLDLAAERGCDGVEPDNVDGHANASGFDLTIGDQLDFNRFVAAAAHEHGLLVGLKNALDLVPALVDEFDFAVNEQCHEFTECERLRPFVDAGKPVFNAEYADHVVDDPDEVCADAIRHDLRTLVLPVALDGSFRISCDDRSPQDAIMEAP